jgi:3-hydroxyisobutyrate dehydrogenase-like beta-hydroxyacid dehydrogenase
MDTKLSLIGFGEAGSSFAHAAGWGSDARVFDIRPVDYAGAEVTACNSLADAVAHAPVVISVVTADAATDVAHDAAQYIAPGALYFDMNSVSPDSKRQAAEVIEAAGGRYVDSAVMAPVNPQLMSVPLLLSGKHSDAGREALASLGFTNIRVVGHDVGRASTIKMLRSVMYKGMEALTAECLLASERAGVTDEVLASFGNDWATAADYRLDRMLVHGARRAAEMVESSQTLLSLGISPRMTEGTIEWQQGFSELYIASVPVGLHAKLAAIVELVP